MTTLNLWFFPIAVSAIHALFLALVLWTREHNQPSNRLFALMLLSLALHLLDYSLSISGLILQVPHLIFTSYPLLFVIAPLFYLYVRSYLRMPLGNKWVLVGHFGLAILVLLSMLPFYLQSANYKLEFLQAIGEDAFKNLPAAQFLIMFLQIGQFLLYTVWSYRSVKTQEEEAARFRTNGNVSKIRWLKQAIQAFGLFSIFFGLMTIILLAQNAYRLEIDYVVVLLLSTLIFVIGYVALSQPKLFQDGLKRGRSQTQLTTSSANSLEQRLLTVMKEDKPFLKEDLKISDLAHLLSVPVHHLSEFLNNELHTSFADYINQYRIETAKTLLSDPNQRSSKILAIAFEAGFSNKATFNRVFKQSTGITPSAYRKSTLVN
ncbi:MAG: helix-turn-helix transcriptional regulator [Saprospiraceae bacterium]|nr:helix-turn-helix transcriptional regulator [Saprospiraceae bacterium]